MEQGVLKGLIHRASDIAIIEKLDSKA